MFARISVSMLEPDLVIMDEFQRFKFLLSSDDSELGILAHSFLSGHDTRVLLLSATPYKLYSTLEEIDENQLDEHYAEFFQVMNFLFDDEVKDTSFKEIWKNYSVALSELKAGDSAIIRMKELAENAMYQGVSRTERISVMDSGDYTDDSSVKHHLRIDGNDINSYIQMSRLLSRTDSKHTLPVDYAKSCPYLMSFMKKYKIKEQIEKYYTKHPDEFGNEREQNLLTIAELSNWNGKAIKIPRIEVSSCYREDIAQAGVYFLFCKEDDGTDSVYIGEAENVKERLLQHLRDYQAEKEKYYWTTAVIFIGRDLNKALIRFLENRFVDIARQCKRYLVLTKNTYRNTVMKESQIAVMEEFIDNVRILISVLGYKVLEPVNKPAAIEENDGNEIEKEEIKLHLERTVKGIGKIEADGIRTSEGFVVLNGSHIAPEDDETISAGIKEKRSKANIVEGILQEDVLFSSPSGAAMFVVGKSANGLTSWKNADGITLKDIESDETK